MMYSYQAPFYCLYMNVSYEFYNIVLRIQLNHMKGDTN